MISPPIAAAEPTSSPEAPAPRERPVRASILASFVLAVARTLDHYQCDTDALFREAGLEWSKVRDPDARYPFQGTQRLWRLAVEATGDTNFGLEVTHHLHPTSLHALGFSWMASASLRDALERMARYVDIVSTALRLRLDEDEDRFKFRISYRQDLPPHHYASVDAALATMVQLCRTAYGSDFHPQSVSFRREPPPDITPYAAFFQAPVRFSSEHDMLHFSKDELEAHLPTANPALVRTNDQVVQTYLARFDRAHPVTRARAKLIEQLPSGHASKTSLARALYMGPRTLERRLKHENTSYRELLEDVRRELASQYIEDSHLSINEMTYLLGFSDPSNFSRAFKRWKGVSPNTYRHQHGLGSRDPSR